MTQEKKSSFGDGPESTYIVRDAKTGELQTGCFVLRPTKEKAAVIALVAYYKEMSEANPLREPLLNWLKRLDGHWKIGLEDLL